MPDDFDLGLDDFDELEEEPEELDPYAEIGMSRWDFY